MSTGEPWAFRAVEEHGVTGHWLALVKIGDKRNIADLRLNW